MPVHLEVFEPESVRREWCDN